MKKTKSEGQQKQQTEETEIDSLSDEEVSNQGDEAEVVQENMENTVDPDEEDRDRESFLYLKCTDIDITISAYQVTKQVCNVLHREARIVKVVSNASVGRSRIDSRN